MHNGTKQPVFSRLGADSGVILTPLAGMDPSRLKLRSPWMVATWPGMGHVATTAGYYLMAHLGMTLFAEFLPKGLFDLGAVEVRNGVILPPRLPLSRFFVWKDPREQHDLIVFIGEAQPPIGASALCDKLVEFALSLGVERLFTFAAMVTEMHPQHPSRVFTAATDSDFLEQLCNQDQVEIVEEGRISGMNGTVLAAAAERGLTGCSLLGEMPHIFARFPYPKAALEVLRAFGNLAGISLDLSELEQQSRDMDERLGQLLTQIESTIVKEEPLGAPEGTEASFLERAPEDRLSALDRARIEELFREAAQDRSRSYELKSELDRLEVFQHYEDRFLDLFKKPE